MFDMKGVKTMNDVKSVKYRYILEDSHSSTYSKSCSLQTEEETLNADSTSHCLPQMLP